MRWYPSTERAAKRNTGFYISARLVMFKRHPSAVEEISKIHITPSPRSNILFGQQQPTSTTINANYQRYRDSLTNRHPAGFTVRDTGRERLVEHTQCRTAAPRRAVGIRVERNSSQRRLKSVHLSAPHGARLKAFSHSIRLNIKINGGGQERSHYWNSIGPNLTRCAAHPLF